jgi:photosystem II stability/assembly factor-like uncharacterized protein
MKRLLFSMLMLIASLPLFAQDFNMKLLQDLKPRNIGPGGMSGRVTAIDAVHENPDVMYVGTASGGLWKSTSGGVKWESVFDKELTASIGAVAIQQSNPSVIWVGTGEGNPRNSLNGGYGVYRSLDGGKNWSCADPITSHGVWPDAIQMENGLIAMSYGRPGNWIMFSNNEGESWGPILQFYNESAHGFIST